MLDDIMGSLFVQNAQNVDIVPIKKVNNDSFYLNIADDKLADTVWFNDRPQRKSGEIPFRRLARKRVWKKLFENNEPNASLSWFDDEGQDHSLVFVIQKPKYDKITGEYRIKSVPLNDQIVEKNKIDQASLFIDASDASQSKNGETHSHDDPSTARKIGTISGSVAGGVAAVYGGYKLYSAITAAMQVSAIEQRKEILGKIEDYFSDEVELLQAYSRRLKRSFGQIDTFQNAVDGYDGMIDFMSSNEMGKNIVQAWTSDFQQVAEQYALKGADRKFLQQVIQDQVKESMRAATSLMVKTYQDEGAEGIFNFYNNVMDIDQQELMNDPDLFSDFTKVIKAENATLASNMVTSHRSLRTMMTDAGFPTGGAGMADPMDSSFAEAPAGQIADQMVERDVVAGDEALCADDLIKRLIALGL